MTTGFDILKHDIGYLFNINLMNTFQMFLSRNHTIEKPHPISCKCDDCVVKQNYDSLKRSRRYDYIYFYGNNGSNWDT